VPGSIVALVLGTVAVVAFQLPVETIGSKFGAIPGGLPPIHIPAFRVDLILPLLPAAMTVALLAAVESLLSAVVADSMTGDRHNSNAELMAQGVANIIAPLVGGIPVTGAIARTATNFRSGARSPVAGLVHALTLLAIVLLLAPLATYVPLATLAAVLFVVAYNMGEWREIAGIWRLDWADKSVWMITFALTVMADLTIAVEVGMALAALLYIYRVTDTTSIATVTPEYIEDGRAHVLQDKHVPSYVTILRIHGPFLFGMTDKLADATADLSGVRAHRHPTVAEHDGDRRVWSACAGDAERSPEEIQPHLDPVWRAPPARAVPPSGRTHPPCRRPQHRAPRPGGAGAGAGDPFALLAGRRGRRARPRKRVALAA
jgi:SulP family sulfate permease